MNNNKSFKDYIDNNNQTNLNFNQLSKKDKLKAYREYLYIDMVKKLRIIEQQKKTLILSYNIAIKELDKNIQE